MLNISGTKKQTVMKLMEIVQHLTLQAVLVNLVLLTIPRNQVGIPHTVGFLKVSVSVILASSSLNFTMMKL